MIANEEEENQRGGKNALNNLKKYERFAIQYFAEPPFPITKAKLLKYLKAKKKTNGYKSFRQCLQGLKNHASHGSDWEKKVLEDKEVQKFIMDYKEEYIRAGRPKGPLSEEKERVKGRLTASWEKETVKRCQVVEGPKQRGNGKLRGRLYRL